MAERISKKRKAELQKNLIARQDALQGEISAQIRERMEQSHGQADSLDAARDDAEGYIGSTVTEQKGEILAQIKNALARLEKDSYGNCVDCEEEISEKRLSALPFAVRCNDCEEKREAEKERGKPRSLRR